MPIQNSPSCPRCGQIDAVQSVTAIIQSGITTVNYQTVYNQNRTAESVSFLAKRLMFPLKKPPSFIAVLVSIGVMAFCSFCAALGPLFSPTGIPAIDLSAMACGGLGFLFFLIIGLVALIVGKQNTDRQQAVYNRALWKWQQLYYCHRDDILFMPGENQIVNPDQLQSYLTR